MHATSLYRLLVVAVRVVDTNMDTLYNDEEALKTKGDDLTTALKDRKDALDGITCSTCSTHFDTSKLEMDADYTAVSDNMQCIARFFIEIL